MRFWIRMGTTRIAIRFGSYVFKFPNFTGYRFLLYGLLSNMQERDFWQAYRCKRLCPVLFAAPLGLLLVMPFAEPLSEESFTTLDFDKFQDTGVYWVPVERKRDSFGIYEGHLVAVDYGS